uniref:ATLF-like domain-containing protein n=1 Tax=Arsenophonus endosymbiont of Trialeurodes vaporariorum TaxID=235567 RepID=A0A3B0M8R5_9GAMM
MLQEATTPSNQNIDKTEVINQLKKTPLNVLKKANDLGQFITVTNDNITNHPDKWSLRDQTPRGWNNGLTWKDVPGVGALGKSANYPYNGDETFIALSKDALINKWSISKNHGSINLVLHEYAHAIDRSFGEKANMGQEGLGNAGDYLSRRNSFRRARKADLGNTAPNSSYFYY